MIIKKSMTHLFIGALFIVVLALGGISVCASPAASLSFDGLQTNTPYTGTTFGNFSVDPNYQKAVKYDAVNGAFGREPNDTSLFMHNMPNVTFPTTFSTDMYLDVAGSKITNSSAAGGESTRLSFYIAIDGKEVDRVVNASVFADGTSGTSQVLKFTQYGEIYVWGANIKKKRFTPKKWYKIDLITIAGSSDGAAKNSYKLYIDNELISTNTIATFTVGSGTGKQFQGFESIKPGYNFSTLKTGTTYNASSMYMDDLQLENYAIGAVPTINNFTLLHSNWDIDKYISKLMGLEAYLAPNTKVSDFVGGVVLNSDPNGTKVSSVKVKDGQGNDVTDGSKLMDDKYLVLTTTSGDKVYTTVRPTNTTLFQGNMGTTKATDGSAIGPLNSTGWDAGSPKTYSQIVYQDWLGGKLTGDYSCVIKTTAFDGNSVNKDPFMNWWTWPFQSAYEPITFEMNALVQGDMQYADLQMTFSELNTDMVQLIKFDNSTGDIKLNDGTVVGTFVSNQWNKIAVTTYPGKDSIDVYVNGVQVAKKHLQYGKVRTNTARFKLGCIYPTLAIPVPNSYSGMYAIDDVNIYTGPYVAPAVITLPTVPSYIDFDSVNNRFKVHDIKTCGEILNEIVFNGYTPVIYNDSSLSQVASGSDIITKDRVLVINTSNGVIRYTFLIDLIQSVSGLIIDTDKATIAAPVGSTVSDFLSKISTYGIITKSVVDSQGIQVTSGALASGMKLRLTSNTNKQDYTILFKELCDITYTTNGVSVTNNVFTAGPIAATAKMNFSHTGVVPVILIVAQFENASNKLIKIEVKTQNVTGQEDVTCNFDVTQTDGTHIKIMALNTFDDMKPLTGALTITPSNVIIGIPLTVYLVSDSICQNYDSTWLPLQGWGYVMQNYFKEGVTVDNRAMGGRSTRSFIDEGRWDGTTGITKTLKKGDYVFLSMGHNDQNISNAAAYTTIDQYKNNLKRYIDDTRAKQATIIFITPIPQAYDLSTNTLKERSDAMKAVAAENNVLVLDVNQKAFQDFNAMGKLAAQNAYFCSKQVCLDLQAAGKINIATHPDQPIQLYGEDLTHVTLAGANYIATNISELLKASTEPLKILLK